MVIQVRDEFRGIKELTTQIKGKTVALNEAYTKTIAATPSKAAYEKSVPLATAEELEYLFNQGNPVLEKVEPPPASEKKAQATAEAKNEK